MSHDEPNDVSPEAAGSEIPASSHEQQPAGGATARDVATSTTDHEANVLESARAELARVKLDLSRLERRVKIDGLLAEADATDIQVARLLTEIAVESMAEPDLKLAIEDLRRQKPYLFRRRDSRRAEAMAARDAGPGHALAEQAANHAVQTGEKRDLLRYLRLRRKA